MGISAYLTVIGQKAVIGGVFHRLSRFHAATAVGGCFRGNARYKYRLLPCSTYQIILSAVLVSGRSGDNAFCYQCQPPDRGLALRISLFFFKASLHHSCRRSACGMAVIAGKCNGYGIPSKFFTNEAVGFSGEI